MSDCMFQVAETEEEEKERQEDEREEKTSDTEWGPPAEI